MKKNNTKIVLLLMLFIGIIAIVSIISIRETRSLDMGDEISEANTVRETRSLDMGDEISEANTVTNDEREEYCRQDNIDRIIKFSHYYYSEYCVGSCILEDIEVETEEDRYEVSVSFVYEPVLYEIKDEMYQAVAYYALQISWFYPEVKKFEFVVLDHRDKKEAMRLEINEKAIKKLYDTFFQEYNSTLIGQESSFWRVFSHITETEVSLNWHEHHDPEIMP